MEIMNKCCKYDGGSVYIIQKFGGYDLKCINCGAIVAEITVEKYKTLFSTCIHCGSSEFREKASKEEKSENLIVECANCKAKPEFIYVDEELHDIDASTREMLMLSDIVDELTIMLQHIIK